MRTIERKIVCAIIISKDNKIFLGKKHADRGGVYLDSWHIPGGGVEDGESNLHALGREILEETGVDICDCAVELVDEEGSGESEKTLKTGEKVLCKMDFKVFKVTINQEARDIKVKVGDDLETYQWAELSALDQIKLTPPSIELFKRLRYLK